MLQRLWLRGPGATMRVGIVCPYSWDVPGGVQAAHRRPGRGADRARARGLGDRAGRRRRAAAALRDLGRPGRPGALQRVGGPAVVRVPVGRPGAALDARGRLRRAARARARWCRAWALLACWAAEGPIVATFHASCDALAGASRSPRRCCAARWRRSAGGSRCPTRPARRLVEHLGGDAVLIPNGVDGQPLRRGRAAAGWPGPTAARSASSAGWTSRARACRSCWRRSSLLAAERPGLRLLIAGPGRRRGRAATGARRAARPGRRCSAW